MDDELNLIMQELRALFPTIEALRQMAQHDYNRLQLILCIDSCYRMDAVAKKTTEHGLAVEAFVLGLN